VEALITLPNLKTLDDEPYEHDEREEAAEVRASGPVSSKPV
jgi:hypothetical protein